MNINTLFLLLASSCGLSLLVIPVLRHLAVRWGLVDRPDGRRKMHAGPIPIVGGLAIFLAANATLIFAFASTETWDEVSGSTGQIYLGLFLASCLIAAIGVIDDLRGMRGRHKLIGQIVAVGIVISCGLQVRTIHLLGWHMDLGPLSTIFTAFWVLGAINSLNLIDGMDGLLGSVAAIIMVAMAAMAFMSGQWLAACVAAAMAGAIIGFLCFNFPPATIFMGDCGSMLIGLVVGVLAIQCSLKGPATVALAGPVALLIIPIFDTSAAIVRRKLTGRSIYTTDRGHLHHCLQRNGMSNRRVLLLVIGLSIIASLGALSTMAINSELLAVLSAVIIIGILVIWRLFGHAEFLLIKERLMAVAVAVRYGGQAGHVHQLEVRLQGSADWNDLWRDLTTCAEALQLRTVCLDVNAPAIHEGYHARWDRIQSSSNDAAMYWRAEIPLNAHGQVVGRLEIIGQRDEYSVWRKVAQVAKIVDDVELAVSNLTILRADAAAQAAAVAHEPAASMRPVAVLQ